MNDYKYYRRKYTLALREKSELRDTIYKAEAKSDRRLGLLKQWNKKRLQTQERCPFCGEIPVPVYGEIQLHGKQEWRPTTGYKDSHADVCELDAECNG